MSPRRVHDLMRKHFPAFNMAKLNWTNIADREGPRMPILESLLNEHVPADQLLIHVHRLEGAFLPRADGLKYIAAHIGQGHIRVADRQFTSFLVVASNGVAAGWRQWRTLHDTLH